MNNDCNIETSESETSESETSESETSNSISSDEDINDTDLNYNNKIIRNYNLIYELGRGSYSTVWLVYNINNDKFYALKIQNPNEYKTGIEEINFVRKLPSEPNIFNNIIEYFIEINGNNKYLCSVWNLHFGSLDNLIRKGKYTEGLPIILIKKIMNQLIIGINILHNNLKVFHGDIKTDNILIKGTNPKDEYIITKYKEYNFMKKYQEKINNLSLNKKQKHKIRENIHNEILNNIDLNINISNYNIEFNDINISIADFGTFCYYENENYDSPFGTRYYQSPEILLMGKCSYEVDVWAIGCTFYELLTGQILFNPIKDKQYDRTYYHLCLINDTCGEFPLDFIKSTKYYKKYFTNNGKIINYNIQEDRLTRKLENIKFNTDSNNYNISKNILQNTLQINYKKRHKLINILDEINKLI